MKKTYFAILFILSLFLISATTGCGPLPKGYEKVEVDAVFMHLRNSYSFMIYNGDEIEHRILQRWDTTKLKIVRDVSEGESLWYEGHYRICPGGTKRFDDITIHLRSIDDLKTAGWNHGKFGSGTTRRVQ